MSELADVTNSLSFRNSTSSTVPSPALPLTSFLIFFKFYFIFKLYIIVLVLPNIKMNPPQVYMCSPFWTLLPPPSPYHPSGSSQCTSPKHPVSCIEPGLETRFLHDILHFSMSFSQIFPPSFVYLSHFFLSIPKGNHLQPGNCLHTYTVWSVNLTLFTLLFYWITPYII